MNDSKDSKLSKLVFEIAEDAYAQLGDFPEEEQWGLTAKLRGRSSDAMTHTAEALGSVDPRDQKWLLGKARANLFAVKAIYQLAYKTEILPANPEAMVKIDAATEEIDRLIGKAADDIPKWLKEMGSSEKDNKS